MSEISEKIKIFTIKSGSYKAKFDCTVLHYKTQEKILEVQQIF